MIAKCGNPKIRVWHWAHKGRRHCDSWWENETEWHRTWKDQFPSDRQEIVHRDEQTGEKHIADVKTRFELVIEFQHSYIKPEERKARENFYQKMIWVADGSRLKRDFPRFRNGMKDASYTGTNGFYLVSFPDECFPRNWLDSSVPVFFDFRNAEATHLENKLMDHLWCLLPGRVDGKALIIRMTCETFIEIASNQSHFVRLVQSANNFAQQYRKQRVESARRANREFQRQELIRRQGWRNRRRKNIRL